MLTTGAIMAVVGLAGVQSAAAQTPGGDKTVEVLGTYTWANSVSGKCLAVSGGVMANGTPVIQWPCNGNPDQSWEVNDISQGNTDYQLFRSGKNRAFCLAVPGSSTAPNTQLIIWNCNGNPDQYWDPIYVSTSRGGRWVMENFATEQVAAVAGSSTADGARVVQWPYTANWDQYWY